MWSYTSTPPIHLHGLVLGYNTGTTLPLPYKEELFLDLLSVFISCQQQICKCINEHQNSGENTAKQTVGK
jgi:hypothetical protein